MAYVYADMDALAQFQQTLIQTLPVLEGQVNCNDDLIHETKEKLKAGIERAEEAERAAYAALREAEEILREAERRTREYNEHLEEGQEPASTPDFYYENVAEQEQNYDFAQANRAHAENTLENFEAYVRSYRQQQEDGIQHFKKLLQNSGQFFEGYIKMLVEAKKCTIVSGDASAGSNRNTGAEASGDFGGQTDPNTVIMAAGQAWTDSLSKEQYAALSAYTGSAYANINETLRGIGSGFQGSNREKAVSIHQALSAASLPESCVVYRGASEAALGAFSGAQDHQLVGAFIGDHGFMSTSLKASDAFGGDIRMIISVPAGAKGAYVGYLSQLGHSESEVLFDLNSVMKITKVERDENGRRVIHVQMM